MVLSEHGTMVQCWYCRQNCHYCPKFLEKPPKDSPRYGKEPVKPDFLSSDSDFEDDEYKRQRKSKLSLKHRRLKRKQAKQYCCLFVGCSFANVEKFEIVRHAKTDHFFGDEERAIDFFHNTQEQCCQYFSTCSRIFFFFLKSSKVPN